MECLKDVENNDYIVDSHIINQLKSLANNPKANVTELMNRIKTFFLKFYQDINDPLASSASEEYNNLTYNIKITNGHDMLVYLLKHYTFKSSKCTLSRKQVVKQNTIITKLARKVVSETTLYTLNGSSFDDLDDLELKKTTPSDFKKYILNGMEFQLKDDLVDKVNDKIDANKLKVPHDTRYNQLMKFINKDCSLTKCSPCKFYQGNSHNCSEKDLNNKDLDDLVNIADDNGYHKASNRLFSYYMYLAKEDLGQVGLDMIIADAQIYDSDLKKQEDTIDDMIGQHWNNLMTTNATFLYTPDKSKQPSHCYQDNDCTTHCPINDDVLHLHGVFDFY